MHSDKDVAYYQERAASERLLSKQAKNPAAAQVHANLAERYERLAARTLAERPILSIVTATSGTT